MRLRKAFPSLLPLLLGCAAGAPAPESGPKDGWTQPGERVEEGWGPEFGPQAPLADWIQDEASPKAKTALGSTWSDRLRQAVQAQGKSLQRCYLEALKADPHLHGDLVVGFRLNADGRTETAWIDFSSLASPSIEPCVLETFRALEAPPPPSAGYRVRYPLVFSSTRTPPEVLEVLRQRYQLPREETREERAARKKSDDYKAPW